MSIDWPSLVIGVIAGGVIVPAALGIWWIRATTAWHNRWERW